MIFVFLSWLAMFVMISSTGALAVRGLASYTRALALQQLDLFQVFWIGCAVVIALAQLFSLFMPLNSLVLILWVSASLLGMPTFIQYLARIDAYGLARRRFAGWSRIVIFILLAALAAYCGSNGVSTQSWSRAYDTDLYHFSTIRWMNECPAVPGLGNLHCRLGQTSGFLVLSALLDNLWWDRHTAWITESFFVTITSIQWLWIVMFPGRENRLRRRLFCLLTSPYLVRLLTSTHPTLYFDDIALLVQLVLITELLMYSSPMSELDRGTDLFSGRVITWLMTLVTLGALGFSIKPTGAISLAFVLGGSAAFLLGYALRHKISLVKLMKPTFAVYAIPGVVLLGHISRNAILTGWLLFPLPMGNINAEWSMPEHPNGKSEMETIQSVEGYYEGIRGWARLPDHEYTKAVSEGFSFWFPKWKKRVWHGIEPLCLYAGFMLVLTHLFWMAVTRSRRRWDSCWDILLIGLSAANLCFWFLAAPDMRFGHAFFWIWMGLGGCMVLSRSLVKPSVAYALALLAFVYSLHSSSVTFAPQHHPELWRVGEARALATTEVVLNNGQDEPLVLRVPQNGNQCGDSDIPCTPYPRDTLQMRRPHCLKAGFKILAPK